MGKIEAIRGQEISAFEESFDGITINTNDMDFYESYGFCNPYKKEDIEKYVYPKTSPVKCIYCNADWSPKMMEALIESGYCETCYGAFRIDIVVCDKCKRIVYKKEGK